jgi:hypothetical protein
VSTETRGSSATPPVGAAAPLGTDTLAGLTVNTDEVRAASYPAAAVEPTRRTHTPRVYCPAPGGAHGKLALGP